MHGLSGIVNLERGSIRVDWLLRMNEQVRHRGPDDEGYLLVDGVSRQAVSLSGNESPPTVKDSLTRLETKLNDDRWTLGLGHRRYAIVDCTAAAHQLRADVPWGADLSGGLDSSAVVALAATRVTAPLSTYTVAWREPQHDETRFAQLVADHHRTAHRVLHTEPTSFWDDIETSTALEEEPYHSPNLYTSQLVRRKMREDGIKMYLNGAGGDEVFAGYRVHFRAMQADALRGRHGGQFLANLWRWSERPGLGASLVKPPLDVLCGRPGLEALLQQDMLQTKMPYWLRSGDKTHMSVPIEARAPFLDYRVVELGFSLPVAYLIHGGWHNMNTSSTGTVSSSRVCGEA